jgi:hypothetical protein
MLKPAHSIRGLGVDDKMTREGGQIRALALGIAGLTAAVFAGFTGPSLHVSASEGLDGCNPNRSGESPTHYRLDGWYYPSSGQLGGATVSLNTYSPYVVNQTLDQALAWSMLSDGTPYHYAQVGYVELPNNGPGGTQRWFMFIGNDGGTQHGGTLGNVQPGQSFIHPALESIHSYTTLWGYYGGDYSGLIDGNTIVGFDGSPERFTLSFNATAALVAGETASADDQMPGDTSWPLDMRSAGWVVKTQQNWQAFNSTGGAVAESITSPSGAQNPPWYGNGVVSNNEIQVWDRACMPHEMAFVSNASSLYLDTTSGGPVDQHLSVMGGTSPSITALTWGGYETAFQSGQGHLVVWGAGGNIDTGDGMAPGTSPSITAVGSGFVVAFQANTTHLFTYSSPGGTADRNEGMAAGTSPSITAVWSGWEVAFQANTYHLFTYWSSTGWTDTNQPMAHVTSPSITTVPGGFWIAYQAFNGDLTDYPWYGSVWDTGEGMQPVSSPSIAR